MRAKAGSIDARAVRLMARVLRDGGELAAEYPLVFGTEGSGSITAIEDGGLVRSACATLVRELVSGSSRLRVGLIGSVVTDPDWRGRGLATRVLETAERSLARDGCAIALLWADDASFYRTRGWREFGTEIDFAFDAESAARLPQKNTIRRAAPDDEGAIHRLYQRHRSRVERTERETQLLMRTPRMETLVLHEDRDVRAYACLGRGADFEGTIHEWGGAADDVMALVRAHHERAFARGEADSIYLLTPSDETAVHALARRAKAREFRGVLSLAKPLDAALIGDFLAGELRTQAGVATETRSGSETTVVLSGHGRKVELAANDLLALIAPPRGDSARIGEIERALDVSFESLPLSAFVWGLDSI